MREKRQGVGSGRVGEWEGGARGINGWMDGWMEGKVEEKGRGRMATWRVAISDDAKGGGRLVVAHVDLVHAREAPEVGPVGIVEVESLRALWDKGIRAGNVKVAGIPGAVGLIEELVGVLLVSHLELPVPCRLGSARDGRALQLEGGIRLARKLVACHLVGVEGLEVFKRVDVHLGLLVGEIV